MWLVDFMAPADMGYSTYRKGHFEIFKIWMCSCNFFRLNVDAEPQAFPLMMGCVVQNRFESEAEVRFHECIWSATLHPNGSRKSSSLAKSSPPVLDHRVERAQLELVPI